MVGYRVSVKTTSSGCGLTVSEERSACRRLRTVSVSGMRGRATQFSTAFAKEYASVRHSDNSLSLNARPSAVTAAAPLQSDLEMTAASEVAAGSSSRKQLASSTGAALPGRLEDSYLLGLSPEETALR